MAPEPQGWIDLSAGVRLKITGSDRIRYLNGQISNDVRKLAPEAALWACVTNHKGRLEALVTVTLAPDGSLHVDGPAALRDVLVPRLEKYIIADDVTVSDISVDTCLLHFLGRRPAESPLWNIVQLERWGEPGWDVWCGAENIAELKSTGEEIPAAEAEWLRIDRGVPAWGAELSGETLPPEAGLDRFAVDYHKGCYIGQEVMSRLKSVGRVNRVLQRLELVEGGGAEPGWRLFSADGGAKDAGTLTSIAPAGSGSFAQKTVALGYVRRDFIAPSARFHAGPDARHFNAIFALRNS